MTNEEQVSQAIQEAAAEAAPAEEEVSEDVEEQLRLPFPNARVVKILKDNMSNQHQIKLEAKLAANRLLGEILNDIARNMNNEEYFTLSVEHFNKSARKYREIELTEKRIKKIQKVLEKQRAELDEIIEEIELEYPTVERPRV